MPEGPRRQPPDGWASEPPDDSGSGPVGRLSLPAGPIGQALSRLQMHERRKY